jgi:UDP-glucose 4-epimerase
MNITVFGGSGFLGSHVADQLSANKHKVSIFDRTKSIWIKKNQKFILGNILDKNKVDKAVKGSKYIYIYAGIADLDECFDKPFETAESNILGLINILNACVKYKVKRIIYASTVYVNSKEGGFYRCSKKAAEDFIKEYKKLFNLEYTILRYGSLYGPRADKNNGMLNILKGAIKSKQISYQGDPEAQREYIHVYDAANASILPVEGKFKNESIILTGHESLKMPDLLKTIKEILNLKKPIIFKKLKYKGHYIRTPYEYTSDVGKKYIPSLHVDIGQGILDLIHEIKNDKTN